MSPKMRAAVLSGPTQMDVVPVAKPEPTGRMVRIRLEGCGVCGSNLAPWEGRPWFNYPFQPGAPGHEGWGTVDAIGPEVEQLRVGDRVAVLAYQSYAEYDLAPEEQAVRLPPALEKRPFPGEPLACALNVFRRAEIRSGQKVAVVGIGFLGGLLTQLAARSGAEVIALSRRPAALKIAREFGAIAAVPIEDPAKAAAEVRQFSDGAGCDCVIEAVGHQRALDLATDLTRERGRLVIAGYHQDGPRQVNMQLWNWRGLDVINAHERDSKAYVDGMRAAVRAVESGQLDPTPLFTHSFGLEEIGAAFKCMQVRPSDFMKGLIIL